MNRLISSFNFLFFFPFSLVRKNSLTSLYQCVCCVHPYQCFGTTSCHRLLEESLLIIFRWKMATSRLCWGLRYNTSNCAGHIMMTPSLWQIKEEISKSLIFYEEKNHFPYIREYKAIVKVSLQSSSLDNKVKVLNNKAKVFHEPQTRPVIFTHHDKLTKHHEPQNYHPNQLLSWMKGLSLRLFTIISPMSNTVPVQSRCEKSLLHQE